MVELEKMSKAQQKHWIERELMALGATADALGFVITVSQVSRTPLAMGNYDTLVEVRPVVPRDKTNLSGSM